MEWGINLGFYNKKLNLNKKLIFYLALVMIFVIFVISLSIQLSVENKILYYFSNASTISSTLYPLPVPRLQICTPGVAYFSIANT